MNQWWLVDVGFSACVRHRKHTLLRFLCLIFDVQKISIFVVCHTYKIFGNENFIPEIFWHEVVSITVWYIPYRTYSIMKLLIIKWAEYGLWYFTQWQNAYTTHCRALSHSNSLSVTAFYFIFIKLYMIACDSHVFCSSRLECDDFSLFLWEHRHSACTQYREKYYCEMLLL